MNVEHAQRVYFEQIKRCVPLAAVLDRYGVLSQLKRVGRRLQGACPIHGGTNKRQFSVDLEQGLWHCFSPDHVGQSGGGMLEFVAAMEKTEIREAALLVGEWFAIRPQQRQLQPKQRRKTVSESNQPTHKVYSAQKREGQKDFLTRIGSAWPFTTKKGTTGLSIQLSALPIGDRVVIFEADDEEADVPEEPEKKSNARRK